ncbi:MAG: plasmid pRiA4b ORF-3 family protein [Anaerolineae bacterium]|nr:plasmid pRiA4b ORF-3 family protein [Anaerolineae bacterium]
MFDDRPFESWIALDCRQDDWVESRTVAMNMHDKLTQAVVKLDEPNASKKYDLFSLVTNSYDDGYIHQHDIELVEQLYLTIFERGGHNVSFAQERLVRLLIKTRSAKCLPFFKHVLTLIKPRDALIKKRKSLAVSGIAYLALFDDQADKLLWELLNHPDSNVRYEAIRLIIAVRGYFSDKFSQYFPDGDKNSKIKYAPELTKLATVRSFTPDEQQILTDIAQHDTNTQVCFLARYVLGRVGVQLPLENPDGTYTLKVTLIGFPKMYRSIEIASTDNLLDLHNAIQESIDWGNDHLWLFTLKEDDRDELFTFKSPMIDGRYSADDYRLGDLGLRLNFSLKYLFDFGDDNLFEVKVIAINPIANGALPRVVDRKGENPEQYPRYDEEAWDDDAGW